MKNLKKSVSIILASIMCILTLSACSSGKDDNVITVGSSFALTGSAAVYGNGARNGVALALKNYETVLGKEVVFVVEDNKTDTVEASNTFNKLLDQKNIDVFIGSDISGTTLAIADLAVENKIPMITPTATAQAVTEKGENVFRACYIDPLQGRMMAKFATEDLLAKKIVILYDAGTDYSDGIAQTFTEIAKENGATVILEAYSKNDKDFRSILTKVKSENPDAIFIPDYYEMVATIIRQIKEMGIDATLLGVDGWDGVLSQVEGEVELVEGVYYMNHYSTQDTNPVVQDFISKYKAEYNEEPNAFAALGYDAAVIMMEAIKSAGSTEYDKVVAALKDTNVSTVTGTIKFDEARNPIKNVSIIKIVNGENTLAKVLEP